MSLVVMALLAHGLCLRAQFFMDDFVHLLQHEWVTEGAWWSAEYRRLSYFFFHLIYRVFGPSPTAFHAWNLGLHLAVTAALFGTGRQLLSGALGCASRQEAAVAAWCGAAVFACHPLLSEAVNYAQNASLQLVTLLTVAAVGSAGRFLEERRLAWLGAAGAFVWLAGYAKEVGFVFAGGSVGLILLLDQRGAWRRTIRSALVHRRTLTLCTAVLLAASFLGLAATWMHYLTRYTFTTPLWAENFFTQGRVFWSYARLLVWPAPLCADHHIPLSGVGWQDPESLLKTLAVVLLAAGATAGMVFRRTRLACGLLLLGLLPLLLRFVYSNKEYLVEYRLYPALPWLALLAGWGVQRVGHHRPLMLRAGMAIVLGTGIVLSARRAMVWADPAALAEDIVHQYPTNLRARTHLQKLDLDNGDYARVSQRADECRRALAWIEAFNARKPRGRSYELSMALRSAMCSEHFYTLAMVETQGSQAALTHASEIVGRLQQAFPSTVDPTSSNYEIGQQMVEVQDMLRTIGPAYDRLRANPQDQEALMEIQRARAQATVSPIAKGPLRAW
jgi:hypothetical protein